MKNLMVVTMNNEKFKKIPQSACTLNLGDIQLKDNGEDTKSAPISMLIRSNKSIKHSFWGNVVHDMAGMHLHKSRVPVDYVHDEKEIVGYLNKFEDSEDGKVAFGALVPFKDSDRATEIIHKSKLGVPYEASINFGGDGIKVEVVDSGQTSEVNGFEFEGPGVIIREWPLRGVAVCPYGADMNTDTSALSAKQFSAELVSGAKVEDGITTTPEEVKQMSTEVKETVEAKPVETELTDSVVETETQVEVPEKVSEPEVPVEAETQVPEATELSAERKEFNRMVTDFGADVAAKAFAEGRSYEDAQAEYLQALKEENEQLKSDLEQAKLSQGGEVAGFSDEPKPKPTFQDVLFRRNK
jgi:hypothetical protein